MLTALSALVVALLPLAYAQDNDTAVVLQDLTAAKIIPDVVPAFTPIFPLDVIFTDNSGNKFPVTAGANLTINQTVNQPSFALRSNITRIIGVPYLMAIVDPDAPTPQSPILGQFRHFLAADFISNASTNGEFVLTNHSKTATLTDYMAPGPPPTSPPHRYVVLCYVQNSTGVTPPAGFDAANRTNFNVTQFVDSVHGNNFTLLAATFFFVSANDTTGSVTPNSTTGNPPAASGTAPAASPSGSSTKPSGAIQLNAAVAWSVLAVLSATGALLL